MLFGQDGDGGFLDVVGKDEVAVEGIGEALLEEFGEAVGGGVVGGVCEEVFFELLELGRDGHAVAFALEGFADVAARVVPEGLEVIGAGVTALGLSEGEVGGALEVGDFDAALCRARTPLCPGKDVAGHGGGDEVVRHG